MAAISANDLVQYKGRYGELIGKSNCPETRKVLTALAYGSLADIPDERIKELPTEVVEYLSRVSLVHAVTQHGRTLKYDLLLSLLRLPSDAALESLVIDAVYEGGLQAKMDSAARRLTVLSWAAREADPATIGAMVNVLDQWIEKGGSVIKNATEKAGEEDAKMMAEKDKEKMISDELAAARLSAEEEQNMRMGRCNSRGAGPSGMSENMPAPLGTRSKMSRFRGRMGNNK
ncbi:hypothetical protein PFISCL1PPCAC_18391 [Pristionchus fissidentatus]|uniref:PCI domain-containing protein n=1 Tax=Pristionchus fissidentatus TaxID=1538716 RepID=A0AAV5W574_9BILA|nr:hypothetical protein PFISCL1PPCAC_18391 [Pristionchus fissidentatus]